MEDGERDRITQGDPDGPPHSGVRWAMVSIAGLGSAEREGERRHAGIEEFDLELSIDDRLRLSDQLIQPLVDNRAVAALVHVAAMSSTRRLPVNRHAETYGDALPRRSHDEVKVAGVKAVHDPAVGTVRDGRLPTHRPSRRALPASDAGN